LLFRGGDRVVVEVFSPWFRKPAKGANGIIYGVVVRQHAKKNRKPY
jgi:hypothetical protein